MDESHHAASLLLGIHRKRRNSRFTPIPPPPGEPRALNCSAVFFMFLSGKLLGKMCAFKVKAGGTTHSLLSYTSFISQGYLNIYLCALRNRGLEPGMWIWTQAILLQSGGCWAWPVGWQWEEDATGERNFLFSVFIQNKYLRLGAWQKPQGEGPVVLY